MTAWVVRGGRNGEREADALEKGVLTIGFGLVEDLRNIQTKEDAKRLLRQTNPEAKPGTIASHASVLWTFRDEIKIGDLIAMPRKGQSTIAIGEIEGEYEYRPEFPEAVHGRAIRWLNPEVHKDSLLPDLQTSMNGDRTIYQPRKDNAENRLRAVAETGLDVGPGVAEDGDGQWNAFIGWAGRFFEWEQFDEMERNYKIAVGEKLAAVKQALQDDRPDWENLLRSSLRDRDTLGRDWRTNESFLKLDTSLMEGALRRIWAIGSIDTLEERVRGFQEFGSFGTPGLMVSILLMGDDPTQYPMYRYSSLKAAYKLTGYPSAPNDSPDAWTRYEHALNFYDEFITQASYRGLQVRDPLDAQSLVWCVTQYAPEYMPEDWPVDVKDKLIAYRRGNGTEDSDSGQLTDEESGREDLDGENEITLPVEPVLPYSLDDIVEDGCFLEKERLATILERLQSKKNVILQGPPGTGKTWLAKRLAFALIGHKSESRVRPFQFHPNLSYEDFVRGWRPGVDARLNLVDGPFLRVIADAMADPSNDYVVVIEEINRGNPAQIFGEMLTLLEADKRTPADALTLSYSKSPQERVHIPPNLYVIGTMNLADRSLALVDLALRRRFAFIDLEPTFGSRWRNWVSEQYGIDPEFLTDVEHRLATLNQAIADDPSLGSQFRVGQSVVTPTPSSPTESPREWFRQVVETEIGPLLDEYWFDDPARSRSEKERLLQGLDQ